tara:strand:+ start:46831 stop:47754 length:924 start_codon:yes stop_codon:yes gene_type:complete
LLLQKEFPFLKSYILPSYNIKYSKSGKNLKFKLLLSVPSVILAVKKAKKIVSQLIEKENLKGVISDNRFGVHSNKVPSIYITHQLNVLSGKTTFITSKIHQNIIRKFDECWVPDIETKENLSGKLGHLKSHAFNLKYIGVLSRFKHQKSTIKYDLLVLLSGPEPQRSLLENKLLNELKNYNGTVFFVRGVLKNSSKIKAASNVKIVDYLLTEDLQKVINESEIVLARSGYSTIMDLAVLGKKAFFIPTPGQFEQEYLAKMIFGKLIAPFSNQREFRLNDLMDLSKFSGFKAYKTTINLDLFSLFQGK